MERTQNYLLTEDDTIQTLVCQELAALGGYNIISIPNMFIFCVPDTGKAIPVLLHANLDTMRTPEEEPPVFGYKEVRTDFRPDSALFSLKGKLGAGRAGLALAVDASLFYEEKPFLLFTNHNNCPEAFGMQRFIKEKILDEYLPLIYVVISTSRSGWNYFSTRFYETDEDLCTIAQESGYIQKGVKIDDARLIENAYGIRNISVSCGIFNKNTKDEYLSDFGFFAARQNLITLMGSIHQQYTCPTSDETIAWLSNGELLDVDPKRRGTVHDTTCAICGKSERGTLWNRLVSAYICLPCTNRAENSGVILTSDTIKQEKIKLEEERQRTRKNNASLGSRKKKSGTVLCPKCCRADKVYWNEHNDSYFCSECQQEFWLGKHKGQRTHMYLEGHDVYTTILNKGKDEVLKVEQLSPKSSIIRCPVCNTLIKNHATVHIFDPYTGHDRWISCCRDCVGEVKEMAADLMVEGYKNTYEFYV